jgi:3'(2'), 5'-bisphosphate nucleotidase
MDSLTLIAIKASLAGGKEILEVYNQDDFEVQLKSDDSPLTKADQLAHNAIMSFLESTGIPVLSEEGREMNFDERKAWSKLWIVDPLDGTKEFIKRNGEFTVNVALVENGVPVLGVIYVPVKKELYFSNKEIGSFKLERVGSTTSVPEDINVLMEAGEKLPVEDEDRSFTIVGSRSHMSKETEEFVSQLKEKYQDLEVLSKGSSLKICMVAEGSADVYPRFAPTMEWDTAAGQAIAMNAGFEMVRSDDNSSLVYNKEDLLNPWFIVRKQN